MMTPVKPFKNGKRNPFRPTHRPASRVRRRFSARLRPNMAYWDRRPRPIQRLIFFVRQILKFHESEPLLNTDHRPAATDY